MSSEWPGTTIGEQLTLQRGFDITKATQQPGTVPVISSGGTNSYHSTAMVKGPGVVLGRKGIVGSVYFVKEDYWPHDTTLWIKDFHGNDELFAYYFFFSKAKDLAQLDVGSANPTLNRNHVHPIRVQFPHLREQKLIGQFLGALDDRITLLRETNATLEAIAQALFKSWFVDFDPVRAKAEGLEPQAMDAPTAALFPDSFEESELGLVPKGWQVGPVGDFVQVVDYVANGSFASLKENVTLLDSPSFALYVRTTDYNSGFSGSFRYVDKQAYDFLSKSSLKGNEVLISNVGDVGTVFRAPSWLGMPMTLGSNAVALKAPELSGFLFFYFKGEKGQHDIQSVVTGSAQLKFNKTSFRSLRIAIPEISVLQRFESIAGEILTKIDNNLAQVKALTQLRDTLLPRLISGQLRLPEAQAWVAEVG